MTYVDILSQSRIGRSIVVESVVVESEAGDEGARQEAKDTVEKRRSSRRQQRKFIYIKAVQFEQASDRGRGRGKDDEPSSESANWLCIGSGRGSVLSSSSGQSSRRGEEGVGVWWM